MEITIAQALLSFGIQLYIVSDFRFERLLKKRGGKQSIYDYHSEPKFSDSQVWTNSIDNIAV